MNIYNESRVITLPHPIEYNDIQKICKELDLPSQFGNVIDLPLNDQWLALMNTDPSYNTSDSNFHNLRRVLFYVPFDDRNKITKFSTDYTVNNKSVLTHDDVKNIFKAVRKITRYKKIRAQLEQIDQLDSSLINTLIDPVTLEVLVDPIIASDGITYSKATLKKLFDDSVNPISPITRERLTRINNTYGLKNILVNNVIEMFHLNN